MNENKCVNDIVPKVLVISGNCFSEDKNNGKTLQNIFRDWPKERLAQFYIWPEIPNSSVCNHYYRITDMEALKYLFSAGKECGTEVQVQQRKENAKSSNIYKSGLKNLMAARVARELIWRKRCWKQGGLLDWINDFDPDIVFFGGINYVFLYKIAYYLGITKKIPILIYCGDDYLLSRFTLSVFAHIHRIWLVHWFKKMLSLEQSKLFTINEFMQSRYSVLIHKESEIIMNLITIPEQCPEYNNTEDRRIKIIYIGNIANNRWKTLHRFAAVLIKSEIADRFSIEVYLSSPPRGREAKAIMMPPYISYMGSLNSLQVREKQLDADVLLHVESFDYKSRKNVQLSLSTKITEYMAAGRPILAVGPKEVASMQFLEKYGGAKCITSLKRDQIVASLKDLVPYHRRKAMGERNWENINRIMNNIHVSDIIRNVAK